MKDEDKEAVAEPFKELAPHLGNTPVAPAHGIAAIALSMAMKYHDIATVQDGALYQQYKLEGKNMVPLHLDMVFQDAERIEIWLMGASERIAKVVVEAIADGLNEEDNAEQTSSNTSADSDPR